MSYDPYNSGWYLLPVVNKTSITGPVQGLTSAQISTINAHTIQGLIETVYVRVGNDVLYQGLNGLDKAISVTSQTLNLLSSLQQQKTAVETSSRGSFSAYFQFNASYGGYTKYQNAYQAAASAFFGIPIVPNFIFTKNSAGVIAPATFNGTLETYTEYANNLANLRSQLQAQVLLLSGIGPPSALTDPNSLYSTTKAVLNNMPPMNTNSPSARIAWTNAKLWALDRFDIQGGQNLAQNYPNAVVMNVQTNPNNVTGGIITISKTFNGMFAPISSTPQYITVNGVTHPVYSYKVINPAVNGNVVNPLGNGYLGASANDASKAGQFQQNITLAITAAQSLNNTQTEQVRAYVLNFEQFYKSASALLSAISTIIKSMAQNIRPA